jgi:nicotinamidase-related amidase
VDETTAPFLDDRTTTEADRHRSALVLIDLQEDFLDAPGMRERRPALLRAVRRWVDLAEAAGAPVIEVRTELPEDPEAWALNMREDGQPVALAGTPGASRVSELADLEMTTVLKRRDDAFLGTGLAALLRGHGIDHLVVAGVSTQACVAMTAAIAYAHDLSVVLAGEAVASDDAHAHTEAIRWLADEYRQPVADPADGWPHR